MTQRHKYALLGKLAADLLFYGPVLAAYAWRLARTQGERREEQQERRRRTTGQVIPEE